MAMCSKCGIIFSNYKPKPHGDKDIRVGKKPKEKSLALAIGLNILISGAGYIYMGRVFLGIVVFALMVATAIANPFAAAGAWIFFQIIMTIDMFIMNGKNKKAVELANTKQCPSCAERVLMDAKKCRHCGEAFA
jgi:hypothetical protein